jgi:FkbM family methyltransferase
MAARTARTEAARRQGFYARFVNNNDLTFDVGANIGNRTSVFLCLGATVVAVEPQRACFCRLQEQFGSNSHVHLLNVALGAEEGMAEMNVSEGDVLSSLSSEWIAAVKESGRFGVNKWERKEAVRVTTLDALVSRYGTPAFIKIDVEGYEHQVLLGLSRAVRQLSFEFTPEYLTSTFACIDHLMSLGAVEYNYSLNESMQFSHSQWTDSEKIKRLLQRYSTDHYVFGDVYARFTT